MGFLSFLKPSCCGTGLRDSRTYVEPMKKVPTYPTLNDIPLGDWQDTSLGLIGYKPTYIQPPISPTSITSNYSDRCSTFPSSDELSNLRLALEKLWELDTNRLNPESDYNIHLHDTKSGTDSSLNFFRFLNESRMLTIPTFKYFFELIESFSLKKFDKTLTEKDLEQANGFLKAFSNTKPGQYLHQYLVAKRLCSGDPATFVRKLTDIWFQTYERDGVSSTAFERIFLGEPSNGFVIGLRSWLFFYNEEKAGRLDCHGYVPPRHSHPLQHPTRREHLLPLKFTWQGCFQPNASIFIGTSPEFEFALYTLCFLMDQHRVMASLSGFETETVIEAFEYGGIRRLAAGYPSIK